MATLCVRIKISPHNKQDSCASVLSIPGVLAFTISHWWKNRLPSSPISREAVGTATNGTFSRGSGGEPRPKAWAQGARWLAGAREGL